MNRLKKNHFYKISTPFLMAGIVWPLSCSALTIDAVVTEDPDADFSQTQVFFEGNAPHWILNSALDRTLESLIVKPLTGAKLTLQGENEYDYPRLYVTTLALAENARLEANIEQIPIEDVALFSSLQVDEFSLARTAHLKVRVSGASALIYGGENEIESESFLVNLPENAMINYSERHQDSPAFLSLNKPLHLSQNMLLTIGEVSARSDRAQLILGSNAWVIWGDGALIDGVSGREWVRIESGAEALIDTSLDELGEGGLTLFENLQIEGIENLTVMDNEGSLAFVERLDESWIVTKKERLFEGSLSALGKSIYENIQKDATLVPLAFKRLMTNHASHQTMAVLEDMVGFTQQNGLEQRSLYFAQAMMETLSEEKGEDPWVNVSKSKDEGESFGATYEADRLGFSLGYGWVTKKEHQWQVMLGYESSKSDAQSLLRSHSKADLLGVGISWSKERQNDDMLQVALQMTQSNERVYSSFDSGYFEADDIKSINMSLFAQYDWSLAKYLPGFVWRNTVGLTHQRHDDYSIKEQGNALLMVQRDNEWRMHLKTALNYQKEMTLWGYPLELQASVDGRFYPGSPSSTLLVETSLDRDLQARLSRKIFNHAIVGANMALEYETDQYLLKTSLGLARGDKHFKNSHISFNLRYNF